MKHQNIEYLLLIVILAAYGLLGLDAFVYPGIVLNKFGFDSRWLLLFVPVIVGAFRFYFGPARLAIWQKHNTLVVPALGAVAFVLTMLEFNHHTNYVYATYGIGYVYLTVLAFLSLFVSLLMLGSSFYARYWRWVIFIAPLPLTVIAQILYLEATVFFLWLISEDSLVEWLQFFLLFTVSVSSIGLARFFWNKDALLRAIFVMAAAGSFFVAGEEISWGQRLLDWATPDSWIEINIQNETNIHNIGPIFGYVYRGYMLIGFLGATLWMVKRAVWKILSKRMRRMVSSLVPEWQYAPYFAVAFALNFDRIYISQPVGSVLWEEPMELLLILGITLFFCEQVVAKYPRFFSQILAFFHTREKSV